MKTKHLGLVTTVFLWMTCLGQDPAITNWMINNTSIMGRHYVNGNSTPINDNILANVQNVQYSSSWVYISTNGIPAYITGPFLDNNPSLASSQNAIFKFPLAAVQNTGSPVTTTPGNIGLFINGVALFDYRDGVSWKNSTNALAGGPLGGMGDNIWNRDAVVAEKNGFDCAKGHPAMGNYHHHQNPSAFNLDLTVISTICNLYAADGLYTIDSTVHSPLIGFAYDGFPIYGAYGYKNVNGSGGIVRIKSGYQLRTLTVRSVYADGTDVADGPAVNGNYPIGYFKEDYEYVPTSTLTPDVLDEHNGRFCITPEYPNGTYAYFCTVDKKWNSAYPYAVGPTFYGVKSAAKVASITEPVTTYSNTSTDLTKQDNTIHVGIFPNPGTDFIAVQLGQINSHDIRLSLYDVKGALVQNTTIYQGSTITYLDARTLYNGIYFLHVHAAAGDVVKKIVIDR